MQRELIFLSGPKKDLFLGRNLLPLRKLLTTFLLLMAGVCLLGQAQNDCNALVEFPVGRQWVYQWYGDNQKPSFRTYHRVLAQKETTDHNLLELLILNIFQDTVYQGQYEVRCTNDGLALDLLSKLTPDMLSSLAGFELHTEENGWLLPNGLSSGDSIPQSYSHITGFSEGVKVLDIDLAIGPVHILDQEDLSTPAGGFPCVAMAYELWVTQLVRKRFRLRDWFAPSVGVIRREIFDRQGKFFGYCELVEWFDG